MVSFLQLQGNFCFYCKRKNILQFFTDWHIDNVRNIVLSSWPDDNVCQKVLIYEVLYHISYITNWIKLYTLLSWKAAIRAIEFYPNHKFQLNKEPTCRAALARMTIIVSSPVDLSVHRFILDTHLYSSCVLPPKIQYLLTLFWFFHFLIRGLNFLRSALYHNL